MFMPYKVGRFLPSLQAFDFERISPDFERDFRIQTSNPALFQQVSQVEVLMVGRHYLRLQPYVIKKDHEPFVNDRVFVWTIHCVSPFHGPANRPQAAQLSSAGTIPLRRSTPIWIFGVQAIARGKKSRFIMAVIL
jgi:hypothetical protein